MEKWDPSLEPLGAPVWVRTRKKESLQLSALIKVGAALMLVTSVALLGALSLHAGNDPSYGEGGSQAGAHQGELTSSHGSNGGEPEMGKQLASIEPAAGSPDFVPDPPEPEWRMDLGRWSEWSLAARTGNDIEDAPQTPASQHSPPLLPFEEPIDAVPVSPLELSAPHDHGIQSAHTHDLQNAPPLVESLTPRIAIEGAKPRIAIVIDDLGNNGGAVQRLMKLPVKPTFAFLPYPEQTPDLAREAWGKGHEIMLHMPMQPLGSADPGPDALTTTLGGDIIAGRITSALKRVPGATGMNNHMGSAFTSDRRGMERVLREARSHGLVFLDSRTTNASVAEAAAATQGTAFTTRDIFLDHDPSPAAIRAQLAKLERIAKTTGTAIGIGHPHKTTIRALERWLPKAIKQGYEFSEVREILALRHCAQQLKASNCDPAIYVAEVSGGLER